MRACFCVWCVKCAKYLAFGTFNTPDGSALSVKWTQSESGKYFPDSPSGDYDFALRFSKSYI